MRRPSCKRKSRLTAVASDEVEHDREPARLERPAKDLLWRAALLALERCGLRVDSASREQGRLVSTFAPLVAAAVERAVVRDEPSLGARSVEYRYVVELGDSPDRARLLVRAEIREARDSDRARPLPSNKTLEREFLRAFSEALGQLGKE